MLVCLNEIFSILNFACPLRCAKLMARGRTDVWRTAEHLHTHVWIGKMQQKSINLNRNQHGKSKREAAKHMIL